MAGRFRVTRFLGQGGMAQVFAAEDLELLGQAVALKVLRPDLPPDGPAARRFRSEALLARRVTHGSVCRLHDVFLHADAGGEETVLVMEMLEGETLAARLSRGPLSPAEALPLLRQICDGLDAAHRAGVAHLDLKSSNVLLVPAGPGTRAVLTDFGLARGPSSPPAGPRWGTPAYMAPEQVEGGDVGPAADLYALGVLAHEMVTGRLPSEEGAALLPAPWEPAIRRCLERDPAGRFATPADFAAALPSRPKAGFWARVRTPAASLLLAFVVVWPTHGPIKFLDPLKAKAQLRETEGQWKEAARLHRHLGKRFTYDLRLGEAEEHLVKALSLFRRIQDPRGEAQILSDLAQVDTLLGRRESALQGYETAAHLYRQLGERDNEVAEWRHVAEVLISQGRVAEAIPKLEAALALTRDLSNPYEEAWSLLALSEPIRYWRLDEGVRMLEQSLAMCGQTSDPFCDANALWMLGMARHQAGDLKEAERLLHGARTRFEESRHLPATMRTRLSLGRVKLDQGHAEQAAALAEAAARFFGGLNRRARQADALILLAQALLAQGRDDEAAETLENAQFIFRRGPLELPAYEVIEVQVAEARVMSGLGQIEEALALLAKAEHEARRMGLVSLRIEAALARAVLEGACADLPALENEARAGGFVRLAREAAAAQSPCEGGR